MGYNIYRLIEICIGQGVIRETATGYGARSWHVTRFSQWKCGTIICGEINNYLTISIVEYLKISLCWKNEIMWTLMFCILCLRIVIYLNCIFCAKSNAFFYKHFIRMSMMKMAKKLKMSWEYFVGTADVQVILWKL